MADRHPHRGGLGGLRVRVHRHHRQAQDPPHLRGELVLRGLHPRRRHAAHRQQRGDPGEPVEVLLPLRRRPGRDGAVVVRAQRGRLLPHRRLPRNHVLLRAQAGGPSDLLLPPVRGALLVAGVHLHVGRSPSPALHRAARLGAVARHGDVAHPARAVVGRDDQRHHDAVRRMGEAAHRPGAALPDRLGVLLRHVHLRRADDVHQDRERALTLHRLDHRPRALGRARLGRVRLHRRDVLPHPALGAPSLVDDVWLYGGSEADVRHSIAEGREGRMPAHGDFLGEARVHVLAAWVWSLSKR